MNNPQGNENLSLQVVMILMSAENFHLAKEDKFHLAQLLDVRAEKAK